MYIARPLRPLVLHWVQQRTTPWELPCMVPHAYTRSHHTCPSKSAHTSNTCPSTSADTTHAGADGTSPSAYARTLASASAHATHSFTSTIPRTNAYTTHTSADASTNK